MNMHVMHCSAYTIDRFDIRRTAIAVFERPHGIFEWSVEYCGFHIEHVLCDVDRATNNCMVCRSGKLLTNVNWHIRCEIFGNNSKSFIAARDLGGKKSVVSARTMGPIRSDVVVRGCVCGWHDIFVHEIGPYILDKSAFGAAASLIGPHDNRYHQVFLHLHVGAVCVRLR